MRTVLYMWLYTKKLYLLQFGNCQLKFCIKIEFVICIKIDFFFCKPQIKYLVKKKLPCTLQLYKLKKWEKAEILNQNTLSNPSVKYITGQSSMYVFCI